MSVVYNRWTGMTGLEQVDWNGGIANVAVWGVRGQNFSSINFAIIVDLLVWPQHHPRKLNSRNICSMLHAIYMSIHARDAYF